MSKTQEKISFKNKMGLSYAYGPQDWETTLGGINREIFSGAEIPGDFLDYKSISADFKTNGLEIFNVRDPLPQSMTRTLYGQAPGILEKIQRQLSLIVGKVSEFPSRNISLDFGVELTLGNPERRDFVISFLKQTAMALHREEVCLCLPARIPMAPPSSPEDFSSFLKETMYEGIRFSADIYPHDPLKGKTPEELIRWFRFDMNIVRFIYEPEAGNLIVDKTLETWFPVLKSMSYDGPVIFCPKISSSAHFMRESDRLAGIIKAVRTKIT